MALSLTETLERSSAYFAAEPAAVSLVAEIQADATFPVEFAAIRRGPEGAELVTVERTEAAAQAALAAASRIPTHQRSLTGEQLARSAREDVHFHDEPAPIGWGQGCPACDKWAVATPPPPHAWAAGQTLEVEWPVDRGSAGRTRRGVIHILSVEDRGDFLYVSWTQPRTHWSPDIGSSGAFRSTSHAPAVLRELVR